MLMNLFRRKKALADRPLPSVGNAMRIYAVGDIHGRLDLLDALLSAIERDHAARPPQTRQLILLGDLIDRGPCSAQVVERAMQFSDTLFIKGNHEELFVAAARGSARHVGSFRRIGGIETLASYGLPTGEAAAMDDAALARWMLNNVPRAHVDFMDGFSDMLSIGDYMFVHAGIRPRVPLDKQTSADLRWIREEFLTHRGDHGRVVVHGHSISTDIEERPNRIGIDTGAWRTGRLTAIGLEGTARWYLQT
ncbi:metallophosphoesterase [Sphingobium mellinum]|uniref:metallophosphoesterase n=1 Tax=Sphingobium mellinum TaxID=1387166 RepID=UPI0030EBA8FC